MSAIPDLRGSIDDLQSRLHDLPPDGETLEACRVELAALGIQVTQAIEAQLVDLDVPAEPSEPTAA